MIRIEIVQRILDLLLLPLFGVNVSGSSMVGIQSAPSITPTAPAERLVGIAYTTWFQSAEWLNVWGTPELGYYRSDDRKVIRQHAGWLADAGVDFIWLDWSNNVNYFPGESTPRGGFEMIENSTRVIFEEYANLQHRPKISIFLGVTGAPEAVKDGRLQGKADQLYADFVANTKFRPLMQEYLGKPLLVVEPSKEHGHFYLHLLKEQAALFKAGH